MIQYTHPRFWLLLVLITGPFVRMKAQNAVRDSISYNSTCSNTLISFASSVFDFDRAPSPSKIIWNFGDPASGIYNTAGIKSPTHSFAATGQYYISLTVINTVADTIRVYDTLNIVNPMNYDFSPDIFLCEQQDTLISAPIVPGATYAWSDDNHTTTDTLRVKESGVYTVSINGCAVTDSIGVFISNRPQINLGNNHVLCDGENLTLDATTQNGQYTWFLNGTQLNNDQSQQPVIAPGGEYSVIVNVPGCGVYGDTVNITFSQPPAPPFTLGPDTLLCPKQVITLPARVSGATTYFWSTGSTDSAITISNAGTYWVFVTINHQCEVVDSMNVRYRGDKNLNFNDTAICKGSTLVLDADFGQGQYNWQSIPPQRDDQNQTGQSTYFVYRPGTYSVTATVGQCVYRDTLTVTFNDSLEVSLPKDTTLCYGEHFTLVVKGNANTYAWQDSTYGTSYPVTKEGTYTVVATNGCGRDTLKTNISFKTCACNLILPNAFTPNGDGRNDTFRPLHACNMTHYEMKVYNRFGEMVFQSTDPDKGWDGTYKGSKVTTGTYVYTVAYVNTDSQQPFFQKGWVVVLR